jgi:hypothetical protein
VLRREVERTNTRDRLYVDPQAGIIEERHRLDEGGGSYERSGAPGRAAEPRLPPGFGGGTLGSRRTR